MMGGGVDKALLAQSLFTSVLFFPFIFLKPAPFRSEVGCKGPYVYADSSEFFLFSLRRCRRQKAF